MHDRDENPRTRSDREEWMRLGNCTANPPNQMFPSDGAGVETARKVCIDCPVKHECLEFALANRIDHGVWGGTSERERRRINRSRAETRMTRVA